MVKYIYTQSQFDTISLLLKRRPIESRDDQKKSRAKIRKLGFMISDYFNGFTDLNKLLEKGEIKIVEKQTSLVTRTTKKAVFKQTILKPKTSISKQALLPIIERTTEYLVLGTMPGEQSLLNQQYYNNPRNQFWKIIEAAFNDNKPLTNYRDKITTLKNNRIGLWDVLDTCDRAGSSDFNIENPTLNNFDRLFKEFPNIKTVIFNGVDSYNYFNSLVQDKADKKYLQLSSTSSANTHKTIVEKTQEWKTALT